MEAGSLHIGLKSNFLYERKFLSSLTEKIKLKHEQFPEVFDISALKRIESLYDFDDVYTGPIHGFKNATDYYTQSSSAQFIQSIKIPGIIINALDDPFFPEACYPYEECNKSEFVELITPRYGGHVGFVKTNNQYYWNEEMILQFASSNSKTGTSI